MIKENDILNFFEVTREFVASSHKLMEAASLCGEDEIKQDMVAFIKPEFNETWARSEKITTLLNGEGYGTNREFILSELKEITAKNLSMAERIENKLKDL